MSSPCYPTPNYPENHCCSSFTGLSVQQFDDIYQKIEKCANHETNRLLIHNKDRKRAVGDGRRFKLAVKDRVIMVLVYYRLFITYTLMEFLSGLDGSAE
jgi:hypothetical protein